MNWEYKTVKVETHGFHGGILDLDKFDKELNSHGDLGWELVSTLTTAKSTGVSREVVAVFKRPKA